MTRPYKPLSKQQADEMARPPLIQDGTYQFELIEFSHTDKYHKPLVDKNGDPMTKIKLKLWDHSGRERFVFTNLFWGELNKMAYRTRHFAESINMQDSYDSGALFDSFGECLNKLGYCDICTQKARDKQDGTGEFWPTKNDVRDFVPPDKVIKAKEKPKPQTEDFTQDSIPF